MMEERKQRLIECFRGADGKRAMTFLRKFAQSYGKASIELIVRDGRTENEIKGVMTFDDLGNVDLVVFDEVKA